MMSDGTEDERFDVAGCLARVRERDQAAARQLVDYVYPMVIRIVCHRVPRRSAAEDLCQEVFLKMFSRISQYRGISPFPRWVSRIAVTTCIDHLRTQRRRPELRWADLSAEELAHLQSELRTPDDAVPSLAAAERDLLRTVLGQLSPQERLVLQCHEVERKDFKEIGRIIGCKTGAARARAHRARRKLNRLFRVLKFREHRAVSLG